MNVVGAAHYLGDFNFEARVTVDVYVPENSLWIMPPSFVYSNSETQFIEFIQILSHPKNQVEAQKMADEHNEVYNSPLMKALRETT